MEQIKLFEDGFGAVIRDGVHLLQTDGVDEKAPEPSIQQEQLPVNGSSTGYTCAHCRVEFPNFTQQREHYKLDWHRYNLKQRLLSREPLTEEKFDERAGDVSSISGSESEREDNVESMAHSQGKILLRNGNGKVFAVYRCLLFEKKVQTWDEISDDVLLERLRACSVNSQWTVLMLGGGHFAGGVFQGANPVLHKTFHCYTVRAGQGSSQGTRDNRSGGSHPKSAGASLRRYNEAALVQHVRDILDVWRDEIGKSHFIIYRAAGPYNKSVLFGGKAPPLDRADCRLRNIPFSTRRATFAELKRVHNLLTTICVYDSIETATKHFTTTTKKVVKTRATNIDRSKEREVVERPLPASPPSEELRQEYADSTDDEIEKIAELSVDELEISFEDDLQTFGDSLTVEQRRQVIKKRKKPKSSKNKLETKMEDLWKKQVCEYISSGDLDNLREKISENPDTVDRMLDDKGNTLLHLAARHNQSVIVGFLLEQNADPCAKNDSQQTPYSCTANKEIREVFRDFAQEHPDKYNYNKAQIPLSVLTSEEKAEKKKLLRKAKREKEKEKKKQDAIKKVEESEKERFLKLSDREKRALAAERRILSQSGTVISRCFLCASDMSGKVPFEYLSNRFCSIECLKAHRMGNPTVLSC